jgi:hypothetical protein
MQKDVLKNAKINIELNLNKIEEIEIELRKKDILHV